MCCSCAAAARGAAVPETESVVAASGRCVCGSMPRARSLRLMCVFQ
uniref:GSVIVT00036110001, MYB4 n=1 Tax=Arundo donax TaxID=35708 RepID=A0A0A9E9A5_ARUDO